MEMKTFIDLQNQFNKEMWNSPNIKDNPTSSYNVYFN
jgi:hypothetical protein